jgi:hypothetical protein
MRVEITKEDVELIIMCIDYYKSEGGNYQWREVQTLEKLLLEFLEKE